VRRLLRLLPASLLVAACSNAGAGRVLTITGVGRVAGQAYLDFNGDRVLDAGDSAFPGLGVRLIATGTVDTVARATTNATGVFTFTGVAAGSYTIAIDTTTLRGDTVGITRIDTAAFTLAPGDTAFVDVAIGYPEVPISRISALPLNTKVFVLGVALSGTVNGPLGGQTGIFGDSTVNIADTSGAARVIGVRNAIVAIGDSDRFLVKVQRDPTDNSLRALAYQSLVTINANGALTPVDTLTAAQAAGANGGKDDAALVTLGDSVVVQDAATSPGLHGPYRLMHVVDAVTPAGALEVHLDSLVGFFGAALAKDTVGAKLVLSGLLVPTGTAGVWSLKPRAVTEQH